jgi:subtilisin family serine protease
MNKNNIWIHLGIAIVLIGFAAILGQVRSWQIQISDRHHSKTERINTTVDQKRTVSQGEPEVLVKFRSDVKLSDIKNIAARNNDRVEDEIESVKNLVSIDDLDNVDAAKVAEMYRSMKDLVIYAEPNYQININQMPTRPVDVKVKEVPVIPGDDKASAPNDPMFKEQWALNNDGQNGGKAKAHLDVLKAWLKNKGSEDVVVAVLDTGVDYTHQDLITNMWIRPENVPAYSDDELGTINDKNGFNSDANSGDPMDQNGHGTHCAGVIGAEGNNSLGIAGINWKVEIMPLKFLGRGGFGSTKNAIEAINYAIDRKKAGVNIRVINASWGSTQYSKALEDAIRAAGDAGILFIAAAGNASTDNDNRPHYPSNYDLPNVISVAALDRNDTLASFSNYGAKTVHIAAPGKDIVSTWLNDGFREASGTSMATPQVAGVAALIVANNPSIKVEDLRKKLLKSVDKLDTLEGKVENGGRINAAMALSE